MDSRLRQRERSGEHSVESLTERLRCGELTRSQVELAAHCGHKAARVALGWVAGGNGRVYYTRSGCSVGSPDALFSGAGPEHFADWLRGLERWPGALLRAAVAAARASLDAYVASRMATDTRLYGADTQHEDWLRGWPDRVADGHSGMGPLYEVEVAKSLIGKQPVREAICAAQTEWALGPGGGAHG